MRPVFAELVQELQRSIGHYSSTRRDTKIDRVLCMGNAVKLPGLQKYLQQNLGYAVERPESFRQAAMPSAAESSLTEEISSFWAAYGLALQGLDLAKVTSNLLPTEIAKQAMWQKKRPFFAAAAACLMLSGGLIWFRYSSDNNALAAGGAGADALRADAKTAAAIIASGPSSAFSDRAKAKTILLAGQELRKQLGQLANAGKDVQEQANRLSEFQKTKMLIPNVLLVIHESVPLPDGPFADADTPEKILAAASQVPRGERKQLIVESMNMSYQSDVNTPPWEGVDGSKQSLVAAPPRIGSPDLEIPGLKLEIVCSTPNQEGAKFLSSTFMEALRRNGRQPKMGFFIDRVWLMEARKGEPKSSTGRPGSTPSKPSPHPGGGKTGSDASGAPLPSGKSDILDPYTHESTENDWRFTVWADVVLQDYEPPETAAAEEGTAPDDEG
jgi:hypothetical protein